MDKEKQKAILKSALRNVFEWCSGERASKEEIYMCKAGAQEMLRRTAVKMGLSIPEYAVFSLKRKRRR